MPIIYTGKKKLQETAKEQRIKKKELPSIMQPALQPTASAGETYSPAGSANPPREELTPEQQAMQERRLAGFPEVQRGQLKQEFQQTENIAASAEALGNLSVEERVSPKILQANQGLLTKSVWKTSISEDLKGMVATAIGILRASGIKIRAPGGIKINEDTTISDTNGLVSKAMATFKTNPTDENAINAMNIIQISEDALIQKRAAAKVTSTTEQLFSGDISTYEYELEQNITNINSVRQIIANTLRQVNIANIQAQTRIYKPGLGGR